VLSEHFVKHVTVLSVVGKQLTYLLSLASFTITGCMGAVDLSAATFSHCLLE